MRFYIKKDIDKRKKLCYNKISQKTGKVYKYMELDTNAHSVFLLHYHLLLVVKYRREVFDDDISTRAKEIFEYIAPNYNITLQEWNHDKDYVHILFQAHPNTQISKFINAYKSNQGIYRNSGAREQTKKEIKIK